MKGRGRSLHWFFLISAEPRTLISRNSNIQGEKLPVPPFSPHLASAHTLFFHPAGLCPRSGRRGWGSEGGGQGGRPYSGRNLTASKSPGRRWSLHAWRGGHRAAFELGARRVYLSIFGERAGRGRVCGCLASHIRVAPRRQSPRSLRALSVSPQPNGGGW